MRPGEQVRDYILEHRIGAGGVGEVWRARHIRLNKPVAIKVILPHLCQDENIYTRFVQEAMATANLEHPHIISVHDFFSVGDDAFLVMSYVEGGSLADRIRKRGRLSAKETLHIATGILDALDFAHQKGIVHRDVKPSNILLSPESHAYLVDFGIALVLGKTRITRFGANIGTPDYMSPEQIRGEPLDHRTDVYSFGCVLYEMLTGHSPFRHSEDDTEFTLMERHMNQAPAPIRGGAVAVSPATEAVIMQALAKNREERFAGCADMAKALRAAVETPAAVSSKSVLNRPRVLQAAVAVLALTTAIATAGWIARTGPDREPQPVDRVQQEQWAQRLQEELRNARAARAKAEKEVEQARAQLAAKDATGNSTLLQLRKDLQEARMSLTKAEQEASYWKEQAAKAGSGTTADARLVKLQKELQSLSTARDSALKEAAYWKEQAARQRAADASNDGRIDKLQRELQQLNIARDNAIKEASYWKEQSAKLERALQAAKKPVVTPVKPSADTAKYMALARKYREDGAYDKALYQLSAASALDPGNAEIAAEVDRTRRACNAEKRLGRPDLKC